ncbi:concanavalin A-like lectin/glucanase domain-containing protein [Tribonema minus]|uniref:Concanavalin A-like lectin/glucanase domain-containing protein n=1 Tax=Tribonema minus TaxID=303371 RepID=A0A835YPM4_9STRA|nr:concanavalin A-like lectin/glucanase domain-containing protein [Tribonema minus]
MAVSIERLRSVLAGWRGCCCRDGAGGGLARRQEGDAALLLGLRFSRTWLLENATAVWAGRVGRAFVENAQASPSLPNKAGAIWYSVPLPVLRGFETQFTFQRSAGAGAIWYSVPLPVLRGFETQFTFQRTAGGGPMWYSVPLPVLRGFETQFTFQITDHSRVCTEHSDPLFSAALHKTCSVRGGDGFAFVLHQDPQGLAAVGDNGAGMGSLAVEFDTWYNAQDGSTDLIYDHITVQGAGRFNKNTWYYPYVEKKYYPYVEMKYAQYFSATDQLKPFLMDNGENRRIGTLVVWVDDGIAAEVDTPLVAIPVNLSILLDVPAADPGGGVYVGFTAATGRAWAKHDIISWYWCHQNSCEEDRTDKWAQFDFHQTSKYFTTARFGEYTPDMRTS